MIRVIHFVHRVPPEYSGAATQALALATRLRALDIRSTLVGFSTVAAPGRTEVDGLPVHRIPSRRRTSTPIPSYVALAHALLATPADIVHVHGYYLPVLALAYLQGRRTILKSTLFGVDDLSTLARRGRSACAMVDRVDRVIAVSPQLQRANAAVRSSLLIPNGVDVRRFDPARRNGVREEVCRRFDLDPSRSLFLYNGGDSARKGFHELGALWRRIRDRFGADHVQLLATGRFASAARALELAQCCLRTVRVIPEVINDMHVLMAGCDVLLFLSSQEGLPNTVIEAAASGMLVVARDIPGVYDDLLFCGHNAVLFDEFDDQTLDALGEARSRGLPDSETVYRIRKRFDIDAVAQRYADLYRELMPRARATS